MKVLRQIFGKRPLPRALAVAEYWTRHNVTVHHEFTSAAESLEYFHWRNDQYIGYIERMPVIGQDQRAVLDYGCGPGHDLVGFGTYSKPARLVGVDVSPSSLLQARARLKYHAIDAELIVLEDETKVRIPVEDASFDYIHSSGVIHMATDPLGVLSELRRVIKRDGAMRVMIYNYDSLFVHLYVAYVCQIETGRYADLPLLAAFQHLTDGDECPISRVYRPAAFIELARQAGFEGRHLGNAISAHEMSLLPQRFAAIQDRRLASEHRRFLLDLRFDDAGNALYNNSLAGIDGCFEFRPI